VTEPFFTLDRVPPPGYSRREHIGRMLNFLLWQACVRWTFRHFHLHRRLARVFGAKIGGNVFLAPSVRVWHPWLLEVGEWTLFGPGVEVYNLGRIRIGRHSIISQHAHLCAGTHDWRDPTMPLIRSEITIGSGVWVCADTFIGPGVTIGDNAVVGARAVVTKDVPEGAIVVGNPGRVIGYREGMHPEEIAAAAGGEAVAAAVQTAGVGGSGSGSGA